MIEKKRLDTAVFDMGLAPSREKAKAFIMAGIVYVNNQKADKAGMNVTADMKIEVRDNTLKYVSRGGLKLEKAMQVYGIRLDGLVCADIGASTGGFTDCMLQNGAKIVYAVDVGYGQLAWKLRCDERVINLEKTNFRYVTHEQIPDSLDFASVDVSFISLKLILPVMHSLMHDKSEAVCLIKPQFEAGRENVGKNGVVRDLAVHEQVVDSITKFMVETGFDVIGVDFSPIKGPQGNIEYLAYIRYSDDPKYLCEVSAKDIVKRSHDELL